MPRGLPKPVNACLQKALDSALLAVETYNKPAVKFKSGGYIVLMCIAWTSLFHAIFLKQKIKPYYKQKNGRFYEKVDGEYHFWELKTCVKKYFKDDVNNGVRKNVEFFIPLRNKIEHRFLPEIDSTIFAECQSFLLNFDKIVEKEFGEKYCLRESLSFALQLFPSHQSLSSAIKNAPSTLRLLQWIENYRSTITTEVLESGEYSFKAFLVQVANHQSKDAMPIQFYAYDKLTTEEKSNVKRIAALVKSKIEYVNVANINKIKPGEVVRLVQNRLGNPKIRRGKKTVDKFNLDTHTRCWKKYGIRPENGAINPECTDSIYCVYDNLNHNYGYTKEWVDFLIEKMKDDEEYKSLFK